MGIWRIRASISCLFSIVLLLLNYGLGFAEIFPSGEDERVELVITYTREQVPKEDVAANMTVVTRREIERIPASNAAEVLQYLPGVYVEFTGGPGSLATVSLQGADSRHVAVYQDGVPLNMLANPMADLAFIPVANIERIEITKGAASSAWGSALGGVIHLITREPDLAKRFTGEVKSAFGEAGTLRSSGTATGSVDRWGTVLSLTHEQGEGFVRHSPYRQNAAYAKLNAFVGTSSRLSFACSFDEEQRESPAALYLGRGFYEDLDQQRVYQRVLYEATLSDRLSWTWEGRHQELHAVNRYQFVDRRVLGFDYLERRWGTSTRLSHVLPDRNRLTLGFDGDWGTYDFSSYEREFPSGNWAAYGNDLIEVGCFSLISGLRYDHNRDFGSELSPLGGVVFHLPRMDGLIRWQAARGFSAPPGAWLHDPLYGNPDLEAETGTSTQLGAEVKLFGFLTVNLNLFQAEIENLINFDLTDYRWENLDEVTRRGVEGSIEAFFRPGPESGLILRLGGSFTDVKDRNTGEEITDIPQVLYNVSVTHHLKRLTQSLHGKYIDHNSSFPETHDKVFLFDYLARCALPASVPHLTPSLFVAVHNLTDTGYVYRAVFPQPGRWVEGGLEFKF